MTRIFRMDQGAYQQMRTRFFRRILPFLIVVYALMVLLGLPKFGVGNSLYSIGIPLLFFSVVMVAAVMRTLGRLRALFRSFTLEVSDLEVTRHKEGDAPLTLHAYDISSIEEDKTGALVIRGREPRDVIIVPAQIAEREELRPLLNAMQPITIGIMATGSEKGRALRGILRIVSAMVVFSVQNQALFIMAVPIAILLLGWDLYDIRKSGRTTARRVPRMLLDGFLIVLVLFMAWSRWYLLR